MTIIPLLYCCFKWNNEDFNIILIFDQQDSIEGNYKCFGGKIDAKT